MAPGAEATTPTSRGAFGVSRGMFRQVGVSPASFPLQGPRENSPFTQRLSDNKPKPPRAPRLEETPETPPSSRAEGLLFLHGLESNPGSSLQTEEEAGLP